MWPVHCCIEGMLWSIWLGAWLVLTGVCADESQFDVSIAFDWITRRGDSDRDAWGVGLVVMFRPGLVRCAASSPVYDRHRECSHLANNAEANPVSHPIERARRQARWRVLRCGRTGSTT